MSKHVVTKASSALIDTEICQAQWCQDTQMWSGDAKSRLVFAYQPQTQSNWLALDVSLNLPDEPAAVYVCFETPEGIVKKPMPMSLKGLIREVIAIPSQTTQMWLSPLQQPGLFSIANCRLKLLTPLKAHWRMWRRTLRFFWLKPVGLWRQTAVSPLLALRDIRLCYRRIGLLKARSPAIPYLSWLQRFATLSQQDTQLISAKLQSLLDQVSLTVVIYPSAHSTTHSTTHGYPTDWQQSISSVMASIGLAKCREASMQLILVDAPAEVLIRKSRQSIKPLTGSSVAQQLTALPDAGRVILLPAGCTLAPEALYWWLWQAVSSPQQAYVYSDHDLVNPEGERHSPAFKPDWSPELSRSSHYTGAVACVASNLLSDTNIIGDLLAEGSQAMVLRLQEQLTAKQVGHIPALLWQQPDNWPLTLSAKVLAQHVERCQQQVKIELNAWGYFDLHYALPPIPPLVSIIIPTRDMLHMLKPCVDSVLHNTDYPSIEVIIVDNQSVKADTLEYFSQLTAEPRVRVLAYDAPFNYSAINNFAVKQARGEMICLLNNDTEVIRVDWLKQMVGHMQHKDVGVVGARLLFADNKVQHAGDAISIGGCANHMHFRLDEDDPGYMGRALLSQDLSAVTAACLLTRKALFSSLGGLNEQELTVAFNDVDYCLRVREAGLRVIYTPLACLYHYESVSRGKEDNPQKVARAAKEVAYMQQRWSLLEQGDPFYNPNLNQHFPDFKISAAPTVIKPWLM